MIYNKISCDNLEISTISLGTWVFGGDFWGGSKEQDCLNTVSAALDAGINLIDTAPMYGDGRAESIVGKAIKNHRKRCFIATKCGLIKNGKMVRNDLSPASILKEVDDSLRRLQIDVIDIYQCHWPDPNTPLEMTLRTLQELQARGKIKYIGVSNFDLALLKSATEITKIVTLQNPFSLLEHTLQKEILPFARGKGIGVITYGGLAGGILTGKYQQEPKFKGADARQFFYKYYTGSAFQKTQQLLKQLQELGHPLNELAINWIRQQAGVSSVIVGARHSKQLFENIKALTWELSDQEFEKIKLFLSGITYANR